MARMTLAEAMARPSTVDHGKVAAVTDEDIARQQAEDGYSDIDDLLDGARVLLPPRDVRELFGMTQEAFARFLGVPVATYRNWEQGRTLPEPAARTLLTLLAREPEAARRALGRGGQHAA